MLSALVSYPLILMGVVFLSDDLLIAIIGSFFGAFGGALAAFALIRWIKKKEIKSKYLKKISRLHADLVLIKREVCRKTNQEYLMNGRKRRVITREGADFLLEFNNLDGFALYEDIQEYFDQYDHLLEDYANKGIPIPNNFIFSFFNDKELLYERVSSFSKKLDDLIEKMP